MLDLRSFGNSKTKTFYKRPHILKMVLLYSNFFQS